MESPPKSRKRSSIDQQLQAARKRRAETAPSPKPPAVVAPEAPKVRVTPPAPTRFPGSAFVPPTPPPTPPVPPVEPPKEKKSSWKKWLGISLATFLAGFGLSKNDKVANWLGGSDSASLSQEAKYKEDVGRSMELQRKVQEGIDKALANHKRHLSTPTAEEIKQKIEEEIKTQLAKARAREEVAKSATPVAPPTLAERLAAIDAKRDRGERLTADEAMTSNNRPEKLTWSSPSITMGHTIHVGGAPRPRKVSPAPSEAGYNFTFNTRDSDGSKQ